MSQETLEPNFDSSQQNIVENPAEKMIPASQVNQIVSSRVREASEKARQRALEEIQMQQPMSNPNAAPQQQSGSMPDVDMMVNSAVQRRIEELNQQAQQRHLEEESKREADLFINKVINSEAYAAHKEAIDKLPLASYPEIVFMANQLENTADVVAELARNPSKMTNISHAASRDPRHAFELMNSLSQSIKTNEDALKIDLPNAPLSQMKSSPNSVDSGDMSVSDFRKRFRSRSSRR